MKHIIYTEKKAEKIINDIIDDVVKHYKGYEGILRTKMFIDVMKTTILYTAERLRKEMEKIEEVQYENKKNIKVE